MRKLTFSGKSEFKGRNGYAKLGRMDAVVIPSDNVMWIDFYSPRGADSAPARLMLTAEDLAAFKAFVAGLEMDEALTQEPKLSSCCSVALVDCLDDDICSKCGHPCALAVKP